MHPGPFNTSFHAAPSLMAAAAATTTVAKAAKAGAVAEPEQHSLPAGGQGHVGGGQGQAGPGPVAASALVRSRFRA